MNVFTVKRDSLGRPIRANARIVALGNKDPVTWSKADCYAPVVSLPIVFLLTALAVLNKRTLKQGDCKNAFVQADLPPDEDTVVRPRIGCPFLLRVHIGVSRNLFMDFVVLLVIGIN